MMSIFGSVQNNGIMRFMTPEYYATHGFWYSNGGFRD
jgi:hypothetical protein